MTAKEYLKQIKIKNAVINNKQRQKDDLREMLFSFGGCGTGERVQSSPDPDKLGTLYSRIDEKEREIESDIDKLIDFKFKVIGQINELTDDRYVTLLYKRYIEFAKWEEIAVSMGYDMRSIYRLHGEALQMFSNKFSTILSSDDIVCH